VVEPAQQSLLASVKDPGQRAQLQAQMTVQNQQQMEGLLRSVGYQLSPAQQPLALGTVRDPGTRAEPSATFKLRAGAALTSGELRER
jgi:hypothetical protein